MGGAVALVVMLVAFDGPAGDQVIQAESWEGELETAQEGEQKEAKQEALEMDAHAEVGEENVKAEGKGDLGAKPEASARKKPASSGGKMKRIFATPAVWALMGFSFLYIAVDFLPITN